MIRGIERDTGLQVRYRVQLVSLASNSPPDSSMHVIAGWTFVKGCVVSEGLSCVLIVTDCDVQTCLGFGIPLIDHERHGLVAPPFNLLSLLIMDSRDSDRTSAPSPLRPVCRSNSEWRTWLLQCGEPVS